MTLKVDWYERRDQLEPGMVFKLEDDTYVRLDRRIPGDGTDWYCDVWIESDTGGHWSGEDYRIHPGDLIERLPNNMSPT